MIFNDLPGVFSDLVLPVSANDREREQRRKHDRADRSHRRFIKPLLHSDLDARAAGLGCNLDRERG